MKSSSRPSRALRLQWLALLSACLAACSTFHDARFAPSPAEVKLEDDGVAGFEGLALFTVRGVRRADSERARPAQVEVLMRLENSGALPFALDAGSLALSTADLVTLPASELVPPLPEPIASGGVCELAASFALPAGKRFADLDWSGLNLRLTLCYAERRKVFSANFERTAYYGFGYGYGPYSSFGWGVGAWGGFPYRGCPPPYGSPYVGPFRRY
ncbi:MAG: hypothetical protein FJ298_04035 [Planctomycetes bacterium]|nr:hypothetical protein [Planctomycetota bacterium]